MYEGLAYISRPVGEYTATVPVPGGTATVALRVTGTAQGKQRIPFDQPVEPNIFADGRATPGAQLEVTAIDELPDRREKTVAVSSDAFTSPVRLTYRGRAYVGKATVGSDATPGPHRMELTNHFGCAHAVAGTVHVTE
ncbi:hypothetical protein ACF09J_35615 [Streptomyces sp. NPDC014889]|uniref:hypothetical protein n=1 Tax=Streptomyces sp. NPDC014889 TaxID=3364928 RepID=UPI0036F909DA